MSYEDYLLTPHWLEVKARMYHKFKRCVRCHASKRLNVHHKHYRSLGREKTADLLLLCRSCHFREHRMREGVRRWKPSDILAVLGILIKNFWEEFTIPPLAR